MFDLIAQSIASGVAIGCVYGLIGIGFCVMSGDTLDVGFAGRSSTSLERDTVNDPRRTASKE